MPSRQRTVMAISVPPGMAQEYRKLAQDEGESLSGLFRRMFTKYKQARLRDELAELQSYGVQRAAELGISESDIDRLVFGDR